RDLRRWQRWRHRSAVRPWPRPSRHRYRFCRDRWNHSWLFFLGWLRAIRGGAGNGRGLGFMVDDAEDAQSPVLVQAAVGTFHDRYAIDLGSNGFRQFDGQHVAD